MAATTHTVVRGDTLWGIAEKYLGSGSKYTQLAAINNIPNPDLIYVGQVIKLTNDGSTSTSSGDNQTVVIQQFGLQADVDNVLFVTWSWSRNNTAEYEVRWDYYTNNNIWFGGISSTTTTKDKFAIYSIPSNAKQVRVRVRPISETKTVDGKEVKYWTANWCGWNKHSVSIAPDVPPIPTVTLDGLKLTAEVSNLKSEPSIIQFEVVKADGSGSKGDKVNVVAASASYSCAVTAGSAYKVRCRANKDNVYSEWSDYSSKVETIPSTPTGFTKCEPSSGTSIRLEWSAIDNATSYDIEYATKKSHFDGSDQVTSKTGITTTTYELTSGIDDGNEYFFRLRAVNSKGSSGWSEVSSTVIGKAPSPPTTWSSTTTVVVGEPLNLYWIHNSEDGSNQTYAHLEVYVDNVLAISKDLDYTKENDKNNQTSSYAIDTSIYAEGVQIRWRVRTAGIDKNYSDFSMDRMVDVYAPPTLEMTLTDSEGDTFETLSALPFKVSALAGPATQRPIGYYLSIKSNEVYNTVDGIGNDKTVNEGEIVYSKYFDISNKLEVELSASDLSLENGVSYTVECTVSMNSGLTADAKSEFEVSWSTAEYTPNAEIGVDPDTLSSYIRPYCTKTVQKNYEVTYGGVYVKTTNELGSVYGTAISGAYTVTNEQVYHGTTADGEEKYYCIVVEEVAIENLSLSVYRREFDGSFTELATGLNSSKNTFVTDPHPALDYARYRIIARSDSTSSVRYYDPPGYPVGCTSIIIQWNEEWSEFDTYGSEDSLEQPPWSGSMLKLPYNVDVADKHSLDVALVEYIGRKHPVSYYGTQLGETSTWNVSIEKDDRDTLYALRRLSVWMGDVYVREPSGSGYWAHVKVSFSQKHRDLTIPVTIEVTRVEGGI
jgi:hypothetical protein